MGASHVTKVQPHQPESVESFTSKHTRVRRIPANLAWLVLVQQ